MMDDDVLPTDDTRSIAVRAKVHAEQLDTEINALREKVAVLEAMVGAIQKLMPRP